MSRERRSDALAIGFLLLVGTALFADLLFADRVLYLRDLSLFHYPNRLVLRRIVLGGFFPYWNAFYAAGQPLAANPQFELFYPPQWLIFFRDFRLGSQLQIVLHVWIGLAGMYALLRSLGMRIASSIFGALTFGIGGLFLSTINMLPILCCAAWIPLILLYARQFFLHRHVRDFCLAALFLGLQTLAGEPTTMIQTWLLVGACAAYSGASRSRRALVTSLGLAALLVACGVVAGAAQFVPALDLARDSVRSRGFDYDVVTTWSMPAVKAAELVFPNALGHGASYWGGRFYPQHHAPFFLTIYCGLMAGCLMIAGMFVPVKGRAAAWSLAIASFVVALGSHAPLFPLLYATGLARSVRYPEKFALFGIFALIVLAAAVFDRVLDEDSRARRIVVRVAASVAAIAVAIAATAHTSIYLQAWETLWRISGRYAAATAETSAGDWTLAALRAVALLLVFALLLRRGAGRMFQVAAIAFVIADLAPLSFALNPRTSSSFIDPPPMTASLAPGRASYRIFHQADWFPGSAEGKRYFSTGEEQPWVLRNGMFPQMPADWGYRIVLHTDYDDTNLLPTADLTETMWRVASAGKRDWLPAFMSMSNARYRAVYRDFDSEIRRAGGDVRRLQPVAMIDEGPSPRYYLADEMAIAKSPREFGDLLVARSWSRAVAFVDRGAFHPSAGRISAQRETPNGVDLAVDCDGPCFLVLSVTPHKYWNATIDSRAATPQVVNVGYQGLALPQGRHIVRFTYRNPLVGISAAVSAIAFVCLLLGAGWRRQSNPEVRNATRHPELGCVGGRGEGPAASRTMSPIDPLHVTMY